MRFLLTGLFCFVVCGCVEKNDVNTRKSSKANQLDPLSDSELPQYQACQSDSDCIHVQLRQLHWFADTAPVGRTIDIAINASKKQEFESRFTCNKEGLCTKVDIPNSSSGKVTCEKNLCIYRP
jgi:hypothetical protein